MDIIAYLCKKNLFSHIFLLVCDSFAAFVFVIAFLVSSFLSFFIIHISGLVVEVEMVLCYSLVVGSRIFF